MATARSPASRSSPSDATMPAMPHMSGRHFFERGPSDRTVGEPPEPQLEHHETPQAMTVIAGAAPMLVPEPRDHLVIEDAACSQASVLEQVVDHRRERPSEPRADRRRESLLRAIDNRFGYALFQQFAKQILAAAPL